MKIPLTRTNAKKLCELLAVSEDSIVGLLKKQPDLPSITVIFHAIARKPWFAEMFMVARKAQAEYLAQLCIDSVAGDTVTPQNAHAIRVKFDVRKWYAGKLLAQYGDKPMEQSPMNLNLTIALPQQRLDEIKSRLDVTRAIVLERNQKQLANGDDPNRKQNGDYNE